MDEITAGIGTMLRKACMWRPAAAQSAHLHPKAVAELRKRGRMLGILGLSDTVDVDDRSAVIAALQTIRRRHIKLNHTQHLSLPKAYLSSLDPQAIWSFRNSYRVKTPEDDPALQTENVRLVSNRNFRRIQRLLWQLPHGSLDTTSRYLRDFHKLLNDHGIVSKSRVEALEASDDPAAIAFGFVNAQRQFQRRVVSDEGWTRSLKADEDKIILQNAPNVMTSLEHIFVQNAHDSHALTAMSCLEAAEDQFNNEQDIKDRVRKICEMMERYVTDFGHGYMGNLTFTGYAGSNGRGPVDCYNVLCDELTDCKGRAASAKMDLPIGSVHKFLAENVLMHNLDSWGADAFADGKIPGWVDYLRQIRAEETVHPRWS